MSMSYKLTAVTWVFLVKTIKMLSISSDRFGYKALASDDKLN